MKSAQFMERLEHAGWRRTTASGSHFTYQRGSKKVTYPYGRPQIELGKAKVRELERRFSLIAIESAMAASRAARSAEVLERAEERAQAVIKEAERSAPSMADDVDLPHLNGKMSYTELHLLLAQLQKEQGIKLKGVADGTGIGHARLHAYIHSQEAILDDAELTTLRQWVTTQEVKYGLTRDRGLLRQRGYGGRVGSINRRDPRIARYSAAMLATGKDAVSLSRQIGISDATVREIMRGKPKSLFAHNYQQLDAWMAKRRPSMQDVVEGRAVLVKEEIASPMHPPTKIVEVTTVATVTTAIAEMDALGAVLRALDGLPIKAAKRVLGYAQQRLNEEGE